MAIYTEFLVPSVDSSCYEVFFHDDVLRFSLVSFLKEASGLGNCELREKENSADKAISFLLIKCLSSPLGKSLLGKSIIFLTETPEIILNTTNQLIETFYNKGSYNFNSKEELTSFSKNNSVYIKQILTYSNEVSELTPIKSVIQEPFTYLVTPADAFINLVHSLQSYGDYKGISVLCSFAIQDILKSLKKSDNISQMRFNEIVAVYAKKYRIDNKELNDYVQCLFINKLLELKQSGEEITADFNICIKQVLSFMEV